MEINLGPIGNAYLPSPAWPIGVTIIVGGVGSAPETAGSLFSEQTLAAYTSLYTDPQGAVEGIVERLEQQAVVSGLKVEALLLIAFAAFHLRSRLLSPWVARRLTRRRAVVLYVTVVALVVGSILVPRSQPGLRIPVSVSAQGGPMASLTVDSVLLADLLDRGIKGITLLSDRQQQAVRDYVDNAYASLSTQFDALPRPAAGETMIMGFSDLHCNQATTELITRLTRATEPALVLSSGDDTVNGTAAERGCIRREAAIAGGLPFLVAPGNHDSNITETQMSSDGMTVLDGEVVDGRRPAGARRRRSGAQHPVQCGADHGPARVRGAARPTAGRCRPHPAYRRDHGAPAGRLGGDHGCAQPAGPAGALGALPRPVRSRR